MCFSRYKLCVGIHEGPQYPPLHIVDFRGWRCGDLNRDSVETPWYRSLLSTAMISLSSSPLLSLRSKTSTVYHSSLLEYAFSAVGSTYLATHSTIAQIVSRRRGSTPNCDVLNIVLDQVFGAYATGLSSESTPPPHLPGSTLGIQSPDHYKRNRSLSEGAKTLALGADRSQDSGFVRLPQAHETPVKVAPQQLSQGARYRLRCATYSRLVIHIRLPQFRSMSGLARFRLSPSRVHHPMPPPAPQGLPVPHLSPAPLLWSGCVWRCENSPLLVGGIWEYGFLWGRPPLGLVD